VKTYVPEVACVVDNGLSAGNSDRYLVSPQQEYLWAAAPNGPSDRTQAVLAIDGEVDASAIADALRVATRRRGRLCTAFEGQTDRRLPLKVVNQLLEPRIEALERSLAGSQERAEQLERVRQSELEASFDLELVRLMAELDDMSDEAAQRLLAQDLSSEAGRL
jgi:hypothetical protein